MPLDEPVYFRNRNDYSDRFVELLRKAVRDRLRTRRIGVLMSGGIDSTTLAAVTRDLLTNEDVGGTLHAFTSVYERLIPDAERSYAALVAEHLAIPICYDVRDDEISIAHWNQVSVHTPEPVDNPAAVAAGLAFLNNSAAEARVFLYGEGPDNALQYEWQPYLRYLLGRRRIGRLADSIVRDLLMHPRIPLWSSLRQLATDRRGTEWQPRFPEWLNADFAARCGCRERWATREGAEGPSHPVRPQAYRGIGDVSWQSFFEDCDLSGATTHTEMRHPFLDTRLLRYMLALPVMPWCRNKLILRRSMRSALPAAVLRRRKTSLAVSPDFARARAGAFPHLTPTPELLRYVDAAKVPTMPETPLELRAALRPIGLNYWLNDLRAN
jgi:asparagine synthase (glutamine-hydrolysing)